MTVPNPREELARLSAAVRRLVEMEGEFGADRLPCRRASINKHREELMARRKTAQQASAAKAAPSASTQSAPAASATSQPATAARKLSAKDKAGALDAIREEMLKCCVCGLGPTRTNLVFGDGNPAADLLFIGEAPGETEDQQGLPFVGRAGQLLTQIIQAIGLSRQDVYIANICKCRPPNNRLPNPDEVAVCIPYLMRQIDIIQPKIIVTLGNLSTQTILQTQTGITKMRGHFTPWRGALVMPTFHPSYLLRNPPAKREVWEDMQAVHAKMKEMGLKIGELKKKQS